MKTDLEISTRINTRKNINDYSWEYGDKHLTARARNREIYIDIGGIEETFIIDPDDIDQVIDALNMLKAIALTQEPDD